MNQAATFNVEHSDNYKTGDRLGTYSGVNLWLTDDAAEQFTQEEIDSLAPGGSFTVADDEGNEMVVGYKSNPWSNTGRVLELVNPFGTVAMASNILASLKETNGYALNYSPFEADAIISPHFEIGDAVSINGGHHGIYAFNTQGSKIPKSRINAPADEEIDHEYPFKEDTKAREITRKFKNVTASFQIVNGRITSAVEALTDEDERLASAIEQNATEIAARVTKTGNNGSNTFAWSLDSDGFYIHNGTITQAMKTSKSALFNFTNTGLKIKGEIDATSGHIGSDANTRFTITSAGRMYSGNHSTLNSTVTGVYIGSDGISLGSNFTITSGGAVTAKNLTITGGSIAIGNNFTVNSSGNVTCNSITIKNGSSTVYSSGKYSGSLSGCGGSVSSGLSYSGSGMSYGSLSSLDSNLKNTVTRVGTIEANYITAGSITADFIRGKFGNSESFSCGSLKIGGRQVESTNIDTSTGYIYTNVLYLGGWY